MLEYLLDLVAAFPPTWAVFFLSMLPITELRASIPVGLEVYHLPIVLTVVLAVLGNMVPVFFLLWAMPRLHDWMVRQHFLGALLTKKLAQAEKAFSGKYAAYGAAGLLIFVGIPLPLTGAWTGALVAFVFKIPFRRSFPLIFGGVCLAAAIVTAITLFAGTTWRWMIGL